MNGQVVSDVSTDDIEANELDDVIADLLGQDPEELKRWEATNLARQVAAAAVRYRMRYGLTQVSLGVRLGLKQPAIARLESGETNPKFETLHRLARELGMSFTIEIAPDQFKISVTDPPDAPQNGKASGRKVDSASLEFQSAPAGDVTRDKVVAGDDAAFRPGAGRESAANHDYKSQIPASANLVRVR